MGVIVRPELNSGVKPVFGSGYRINPYHLLNQGLVAWWMFNSGAGAETSLGRGAIGSLIGTAAWVPQGVAIDSGGNSAVQYSAPFNGLRVFGTGPCTAVIRFIKSNATRGQIFGDDMGTAYIDLNGSKIHINWGSPTGDSEVDYVPIGSVSTIVVTRSGTGTNLAHAYVNGILAWTFTASLDFTTGVSITGSWNRANFGINGILIGAALYTREFSQNEAIDIHAFPYGTRLLFPSSKRYFVPSGAAPPIIRGPFPVHLRIA